MSLRFSELCIDAADVHALGQWWSAALGWPSEVTEDGDVLLRAPAGPDWLFLPVPDGKVVKNRIHADFTYNPESTEVQTRAPQALELRAGVCQDYAHVMISAMRSLGLAARYVSGYLRSHPKPGEEQLVGADASHAWVSVWCPVNGWVEFDPTNNRLPAADYVRIAMGRDFADVSPLRGVIRGGGEHTLEVGVHVSPVGGR